jgi:hypothetical protein
VVKGGALVDRPFLDITGRIASGGERGLLGLAFHPDYPTIRASSSTTRTATGTRSSRSSR